VLTLLFRYLRPAILAVEGAQLNAQTFERAYYERYREQVTSNALEYGWAPEEFATAYGSFQILGENLARLGLSRHDLLEYLERPDMQEHYARKHFDKALGQLIRRRGLGWGKYIYSMWNAGVNFNEDYDRKIRRALKR